MDQSVSPVGRSVSEAATGHRAKSATYREMEQRSAPLEQLARLVTMHRAEIGIAQQELAQRVGTTASAISRLASGHHRINLSTLQRVAEGLDMCAVIGFELGVRERTASRARYALKPAGIDTGEPIEKQGLELTSCLGPRDLPPLRRHREIGCVWVVGVSSGRLELRSAATGSATSRRRAEDPAQDAPDESPADLCA